MVTFWSGKRVLVTGHTGFKGQWLARRLEAEGALVRGWSLPNDIRAFIPVYTGCDVVFHLAAQALTKVALDEPVSTIDVNVRGAANLLDWYRESDVKAIVVVTSDKVYRNDDRGFPFRETDPLGGDDPYAASKVAVEEIARAYRLSYGMPIVTARAGNVVGGGDFSPGRLIPDVWRALKAGEPLVLRQPFSTRPWTYVEDVVDGYMLYAQAVAEGKPMPLSLNFGPEFGAPTLTALETAEVFADEVGATLNYQQPTEPYREKNLLFLNTTLARATLGWSEKHPGEAGVRMAARWYKEHR